MALVFGFEVNLLEILVVVNAVLIIAVLAVLFELYRLKQLLDEAISIEKMHSQEKGRKQLQ
ncbi:MAG: hypothetical protein V1717_03490 [Candidatus Micrarchaeota archaeon]